jgi:hypothetical protein
MLKNPGLRKEQIKKGEQFFVADPSTFPFLLYKKKNSRGWRRQNARPFHKPEEEEIQIRFYL